MQRRVDSISLVPYTRAHMISIFGMLQRKVKFVLRGGLAENTYNWRPLQAQLAAAQAQAHMALEASGKAQPHVVLAMSLYLEQFVNMYALLAAALQLRGARVSILVDDGTLPMTEKNLFYRGRHDFKKRRFDYLLVQRIFKPLGVTIVRMSEFVTAADRQASELLAATITMADVKHYTPDGLAIGEHALAGALRYFARGTIAQEPVAERVVRRYVVAAELTRYAIQRLVAQQTIDVACFHHGIYVPQGIIGEVLRQHHIRVVNWNVAYREKCFIFSHTETYHHSLMSESVTTWENLKLTPALDEKISQYLVSRHKGSKDWISFNRAPQEDIDKICAQHQIDPNKPAVALLTNVIWDAQLHYRTNVFPNMIDWVLKTITYFSKRPDLQLIIRIHPAECKGTIPSRQPMADEIARAFPTLPTNVIVIRPEDATSTYVVTSMCNAAIIFGTKTGVELVTTGLPTIVAGEAWIKSKGLTIDPTSESDYYKTLDTLPLAHGLDANTIQRAKRYAYHFFFRRMIPVQAIQPRKSIAFGLQLESLADLQPGADRGLDVICDGILHGTPFIYPAEQIETQAESSRPVGWLDMR